MDFFFPKDPSISKDPSIEGTIQLGWEKEARADPGDCSWVGWGGGSNDGNLTRHTVSTQTLEPQLLELRGSTAFTPKLWLQARKPRPLPRQPSE